MVNTNQDMQNILSEVWPDYQLEAVVGHGSFGTVYEASRLDRVTSSRVAIKIVQIPSDLNEVEELRAEGLLANQTRQYFQSIVQDYVREIQLMDALKGHPNIVYIEDYKIHEVPGRIMWYILIRMPLLTPLRRHLELSGGMDEKQLIRLGIDLCKALEVCHQHRIIHRDIKPENIFTDSRGNYLLGDFGVARTLEQATHGLSRKGTPNYMAPELYKASVVNEDFEKACLVDLYSLGLVLYYIGNGMKLPFYPTDQQVISSVERDRAFVRRISGESLPPPRCVSSGLQQVILKAAAYNPEDRYSTAEELRLALEGLLVPTRAGSSLKDADATLNTAVSGHIHASALPESVPGDATPRLANVPAAKEASPRTKLSLSRSPILLKIIALITVIVLLALIPSAGPGPDPGPADENVLSGTGSDDPAAPPDLNGMNAEERKAYLQQYLAARGFSWPAAGVELAVIGAVIAWVCNSVTLSPKELKISSATQAWVYDAQIHTAEIYTVTYGGEHVEPDETGKVFTLSTGDTVTIRPTAPGVKYVTDSANENNTFAWVLTNAERYDSVSTESGTLSIVPATLTITADSHAREYDGTPLTDGGWMDTPPAGLQGTDTVAAVTVTGSITGMGTADNVPSEAVVINGTQDVTANYTITYVNGTLEILPDSNALMISSASGNWGYDAQAHTAEAYTVTYGGENVEPDETGKVFTLITGDTVTITPTTPGVRYVTDSTEGNNTFSYVLTHPERYGSVSTHFGTLSITPAPLTITADSSIREYDGTALTDSGWTDTPPAGLQGTDTVAAVTVTGSITGMGTADNVPSEAVVMNGTQEVTANYAITYVNGTLHVMASSNALIISSTSENWMYDAQPHTAEAYTVTYDGQAVKPDETGKVFTLSTGDTVTIQTTAPGVKYVTDSAEGNNTFSYELTHPECYDSVSTHYGTLSITPAPLTVTADSHAREYDGTPLTDDGWMDTPPAGLQGTDTVAAVTVTGSITGMGTADNAPGGAVVMNGTRDVTANYLITYVNGTLRVTASSSALIISSASGNWGYDAQTHTAEAYTVTYGGENVEPDETGKVFTLITGDTVTITPTTPGVSYVTDGTEGNNTFSYVLTHPECYGSVSTDFGTLSIAPAPLTVTADSCIREYDGTALTDSGWTDTPPAGLQGTDTVTAVTVTGSITGVGTADNMPSKAVVMNGAEDVTANYAISYVNGTLRVTASSSALIISSASGDWVYDAQPHMAEAYVVTYDGRAVEPDETGKVFILSTGDTVTITPTTPGVKYVADSTEGSNTFTYVLTHAECYGSVSTDFGTLSIAPAPLTVTADSSIREYDGTALTDGGWTDTPPAGLQGTDTVAAVTVTGTVTRTGTADNVPGGAVVMNGTQDVTANYAITYVNGTLEILPATAALTISSGDCTWEYDGADHSFRQYTVTFGSQTIMGTEGQTEFVLTTGDTVTISGTASVRDPEDTAEGNNTFTYELTNRDQYRTVRVNYGTLTITPARNRIPGDLNGDGVTNLHDVLLLQAYLDGDTSDLTEERCDVNKDGVVNTKDLSLLLELIELAE